MVQRRSARSSTQLLYKSKSEKIKLDKNKAAPRKTRSAKENVIETGTLKLQSQKNVVVRKRNLEEIQSAVCVSSRNIVHSAKKPKIADFPRTPMNHPMNKMSTGYVKEEGTMGSHRPPLVKQRSVVKTEIEKSKIVQPKSTPTTSEQREKVITIRKKVEANDNHNVQMVVNRSNKKLPGVVLPVLKTKNGKKTSTPGTIPEATAPNENDNVPFSEFLSSCLQSGSLDTLKVAKQMSKDNRNGDKNFKLFSNFVEKYCKNVTFRRSSDFLVADSNVIQLALILESEVQSKKETKTSCCAAVKKASTIYSILEQDFSIDDVVKTVSSFHLPAPFQIDENYIRNFRSKYEDERKMREFFRFVLCNMTNPIWAIQSFTFRTGSGGNANRTLSSLPKDVAMCLKNMLFNGYGLDRKELQLDYEDLELKSSDWFIQLGQTLESRIYWMKQIKAFVAQFEVKADRALKAAFVDVRSCHYHNGVFIHSQKKPKPERILLGVRGQHAVDEENSSDDEEVERNEFVEDEEQLEYEGYGDEELELEEEGTEEAVEEQQEEEFEEDHFI